MKIIILLLFVFMAASITYGQQSPPTTENFSQNTLRELERIQAAALKSDYAYEQVAYLTNHIGPRISGSAQAGQAVQYVAGELRKLGLEVRLQKVMVPHWVRGVETGSVVEWPGMAPGTEQKIVLTALGGSIATPETGLTADVVVVKDFDELTRLGRKGVEGKIVLFNNKFDAGAQDAGFGLMAYGQAVAYRSRGASAAAKLGAIGVLVRSAGGSQNRLAHTGAMDYQDGVIKIPAAAITYEDADLLANLVVSGPVKVKFTITPKTLDDAVSYNVIGDLKGSEKPDEIVIVSGHLDSWDLATGAIDDAAGVAVAMQVPYLLNQLKIRPKRTIRVIAWMDEEQAGRGSEAYFKEQSGNVSKHFAAIESDLGASHPLGFVFAGKREALPYLAPISKILLSQGAGFSQIQQGVGADIGPFTQQGVPSFAPWFDQRTYFKYHHTEADTLDKIVPEELREVGSLISVLATGLADLERPLPR